MSSHEPIGGFFELELQGSGGFPHDGAVLLNTGRACIELALRGSGAAHIHVPRYTCDVVLEPIERCGVPYTFYDIDERLEVAALPELGPDDLLLYTNYFGLKDVYAEDLAGRYGSSLILDNSQALFAKPPAESYSFYSPRKFVGVPDGGMLYTLSEHTGVLEPDTSKHRYTHLIGRIDGGPASAYDDFRRSDAALAGQGVKAMSRSTRRLLSSIDFEAVRERRLANYAILHEALGHLNALSLPKDGTACPMVYPLLLDRDDVRRRLIENGIFVATFWPNVLHWCGEGSWEHRLAKHLLPLPIDQRYGASHMRRVADVVLEAVA